MYILSYSVKHRQPITTRTWLSHQLTCSRLFYSLCLCFVARNETKRMSDEDNSTCPMMMSEKCYNQSIPDCPFPTEHPTAFPRYS